MNGLVVGRRQQLHDFNFVVKQVARFPQRFKVAAYRTRFEAHESAQREIFCCIETYGRTSEPFVAKSERGTYSPGALRQTKWVRQIICKLKKTI